MTNKMNKLASSINKLPEAVRIPTMTTVVGKIVKFTGTAGIRIEKLTDAHSVISVKNKKKVQNHIGSVHAVASILIAESATGYLIGMNAPDDSIPVIKTIKADYKKRCVGDMRAEAHLSEEQINYIKTEPKGETIVPVTVTDGEGKEPIEMEMTWAWTPKRR